MHEDEDSSLQWLTGAAKAKDWIIVAGVLNVAPDEEFTRVYIYKSGEWGYFDLPDRRVCSIYANPGDIPGSYFLARRGQLIVTGAAEPTTEGIQDSAKFGYLNQIRRIGDKLYVCGYSGQVYRREQAGWMHFDDRLLEPPELRSHVALASIDGTSDNDIYTVGSGGTVAHFDGKSWNHMMSATNLYLTWVRCLSTANVYVCGFKGTLLRYTGGRLQVLTDPSINSDFWCVEAFQNKIYVASLSQVYVLEGDKLTPTPAGVTTPKPDAFRLCSTDGALWSIGQRYVCFFDGDRWRYVEHPDNP